MSKETDKEMEEINQTAVHAKRKKGKSYLIIAAILILSILFAFVAPALDFIFWLLVYVGVMGSIYTGNRTKIVMLILPILAGALGVAGYYYANQNAWNEYWISMSVVVAGCAICCEMSGIFLVCKSLYQKKKGKNK